jgi:hypothetical protein
LGVTWHDEWSCVTTFRPNATAALQRATAGSLAVGQSPGERTSRSKDFKGGAGACDRPFTSAATATAAPALLSCGNRQGAQLPGCHPGAVADTWGHSLSSCATPWLSTFRCPGCSAAAGCDAPAPVVGPASRPALSGGVRCPLRPSLLPSWWPPMTTVGRAFPGVGAGAWAPRQHASSCCACTYLQSARVGRAFPTSACTYLQSARVLLLLLQIPTDTARLLRHREGERGAPFGLPGRFASRSCGSVAPRQKIPMVYGGLAAPRNCSSLTAGAVRGC